MTGLYILVIVTWGGYNANTPAITLYPDRLTPEICQAYADSFNAQMPIQSKNGYALNSGRAICIGKD